MLRKQLTGHTNEKVSQIRGDTVGGKTIYLTNRVWDVLTNILCRRQLDNRCLQLMPLCPFFECPQIKLNIR